ncbi:MAG TPA: RDD family protein [Candidatus Limnocylindrales bacterium]
MTQPPIPPMPQGQPGDLPAPQPAVPQPAVPQPPAAQPPTPPAQPPAYPPQPSAAYPPAGQPADPAHQPWNAPTPAVGPAPGVKYAGHGARLIAYIVDGFIASLLVWAVIIVFGILVAAMAATGSDTATALGIIAFFAAVIVVSLAYFPWFWAHGGQTPGSKMLRLKVVRAVDGGPLTGTQAILRLIGLWISFAVFYLGVIWILIDPQRQGWHDKIASTVMIEVP